MDRLFRGGDGALGCCTDGQLTEHHNHDLNHDLTCTNTTQCSPRTCCRSPSHSRLSRESSKLVCLLHNMDAKTDNNRMAQLHRNTLCHCTNTHSAGRTSHPLPLFTPYQPSACLWICKLCTWQNTAQISTEVPMLAGSVLLSFPATYLRLIHALPLQLL